MECQAPQRLDENGNVRQEYIDFMKKIPSPEERAKMTDDEILDWFISRRGGDRETIREKLGDRFEKVINLWYSRFMKPSMWERRILALTGVGMSLSDWEILKIHDLTIGNPLNKKLEKIINDYCIYDFEEDNALLRS